jgi:beta-glucanase (GH16 family)
VIVERDARAPLTKVVVATRSHATRRMPWGGAGVGVTYAPFHTVWTMGDGQHVSTKGPWASMRRWIVVAAAAAVVIAAIAVCIVTVLSDGAPPRGDGPSATRTGVHMDAPQTRMPGEPFRVRGRATIKGALLDGLPVHLQRQDESGGWTEVGTTDTRHHGAYAFPALTLDQLDGTATLRTYVDPGALDDPVFSTAREVRLVPQTIGVLVQPRLIDPGLHPAPLSAAAARGVVTLTPARAGRSIEVYQRPAASQEAWQPLTTLETDTEGRAYFRAWATTEYKAVAPAWRGVTEVTSLAAGLAGTPSQEPTFVDEFGAFDPTKWVDRPGQDVYGAGANTMCAKASPAARSVADGVLSLGVLPDPDAPEPCTDGDPADGPLQHVLQGHVQSTTFVQARGWFVARVKFQASKGSYGAFWLSAEGYGRGSAETDIAEYTGASLWGDSITANWDADGSSFRSSPQRFQYPDPMEGREFPIAERLQSAEDAYHVYAVHWTAAGYDFYVDGNLVGSVQDQSAYKPGRVVLSNLVRDWNQKNLRDISDPAVQRDYVVDVDWVAVYEE